MAVFPDRRVVTGSEDKTMRIWNSSSGECERVLEGHTSVSRWLCLDLRVRFEYQYLCVRVGTCTQVYGLQPFNLIHMKYRHENCCDVFTIDYVASEP